jgi:hypothetical protein
VSEYHRVQTQIKDEALLRKALDDAGLPYEQGEGLALYGYQGDRRRETAEYVIRRQAIGPWANDLGFHRASDGTFQAIISNYDQGSRGQEVLDQVLQGYAYHAITRTYQAKGYTVTEQTAGDGTIRLQLRRY